MLIEKLQKRREALLKRLAQVGPFVEGSIVRLPHPSCDHVAYRLTFKARGQTKTVYIPVDLVEEVEQWHRNYKRLKKLTRQITKTSLGILHRYVPERRGARSRSKARERTWRANWPGRSATSSRTLIVGWTSCRSTGTRTCSTTPAATWCGPVC